MLLYGEIDMSAAAEAGLFAVPAFFVTFRETLEAAIIVSVLLGLLNKTNLPELRRYVWLGVLSALCISICMAVIALILISYAKDQVLDPNTQRLIEGIISVVAAILIAFVAVSIGNVMAKTKKYEARLATDMNSNGSDIISHHTIFWMAFTAVFREGVETIIFFVAIGANYPGESLPIPAVTGAIVGLISGWALYKFGGRLTIKIFFRATMVVLIFIGAGIFTVGIHGLQQVGAFGTWEPAEDRAPINQDLWDWQECCGLQNQFWVMMRVLFGYSPNPTGLELMFYLLFHLVVWSFVVVRYKNDMRELAGKPTYKQILAKQLCGCRATDDSGQKENTAMVTADDPASSGKSLISRSVRGSSQDIDDFEEHMVATP